jgi:hypothetical protein
MASFDFGVPSLFQCLPIEATEKVVHGGEAQITSKFISNNGSQFKSKISLQIEGLWIGLLSTVKTSCPLSSATLENDLVPQNNSSILS